MSTVWRLTSQGKLVVETAAREKGWGLQDSLWITKANCDLSSLKRFRNPKQGVSPDIFKALCDAVGIAPDRVRNMGDEKPPEIGERAPKPDSPSGAFSIGSLETGDNSQIAYQINNYNQPQHETIKPRQEPDLPEAYVKREEPFEEFKKLLLEPANSYGTVVINSIHGMGGVGKTTLAIALAKDPDVRNAFSGGTLWATLGKAPNLLTILSDWIQALGDYNFKPNSEATAVGHLRTLLRENDPVLIIIDDLWRVKDFEAFNLKGKGNKILVTTREARLKEAKTEALDEMTPEEAMQFLKKKAPEDIFGDIEEDAAKFAKAAGYLPLALELGAGRVTEDGISWQELLSLLQDEIARLEEFVYEIDEESMEDDTVKKVHSLQASLNLSIEGLKDSEKKI